MGFVNRRNFLRSASIVSANVAFPVAERLLAKDAPEGWRTFEVTTRVEIVKSSEATRVWLPAAIIRQTAFQRTLSNKFSADGGTARMVEGKPDGLGIIAAELPAG